MSVIETTARTAEVDAAQSAIIDCDVHNILNGPEELEPYLAKKWRGVPEWPGVGRLQAGLHVGAPARTGFFRDDAEVGGGGLPGSDVDRMREQLLDAFGIQAALLHPIVPVTLFPQSGERGAALAAATNDWMVDRWLDSDPRLYGGITVPVEDGNFAAREIDRVADDQRFVKVVVTTLTREPLGDSKYWPLYEAASAHGLPIAAHVTGFSGAHSAPGWATYFTELHTNFVLAYSAQVASLVAGGVFKRFPDLNFVFEEGGVAWLRPLMWRMDRVWREMPDEIPDLDEPPSAVIRRHIWLTTQPMDEPEKRTQLGPFLDQLDMDDHLLFATDYPHHDFDDPRYVFRPRDVGAERREQILSRNALELYSRLGTAHD